MMMYSLERMITARLSIFLRIIKPLSVKAMMILQLSIEKLKREQSNNLHFKLLIQGIETLELVLSHSNKEMKTI